MTAFDIYSAIGRAGEDILEESEIMPKKKTAKMIPLITAAACILVTAAGVSHRLRSDNIEQPEEDMTAKSSTAGTSIHTSPYETAGEESSQTAESGFTVSTYTASNAPTETSPHVTEDITSESSTVGTPPGETAFEETAPVTEDVIIFPPFSDPPALTETSADITKIPAESEQEMAEVPKWDNMSDLEKYPYLDYKGNTYGITSEHFDKSELTFLQNIRLYGFDENHTADSEEPSEHFSVPCAVYSINNISTDYMVAALTADGLYTGFQREQYYADDLSDYLDDTDFLSRMEINDVVAFEEGSGLSRREYTVNDLPYAVEKLLTCAPDAPMSVNPPHDIGYIFYGILHEGKWQMQVYESGYIYIGRFFFVGTEHTDEFIGYVTENAVNAETVTYGTASAGGNDIPE